MQQQRNRSIAEGPFSDVGKRFGAAVKKAREGRGISQRELSQQLRTVQVTLDPSAIARIESGQREAKVGEVSALLHILGMHWDTDLRDPIDDIVDGLHAGYFALIAARENAVKAADALALRGSKYEMTELDAQFLYETFGAATYRGAAMKVIEKATDWKHMEDEVDNLTIISSSTSDDEAEILRAVTTYITDGLVAESPEVWQTRPDFFDKWERWYDWDSRDNPDA
jgi:transcriptional regulator with XRE-family HTH domain